MKFALFAFFILSSCQNQPDATQSSTPAPTKDTIIARPRQYIPVPPNAPQYLPPVHKFPGRGYQRVVAHQLTGNPPSSYAGAVFQEQISKSVDLNAAQVKAFLQLINDRNSYKAPAMACFEPGIGLIFYDTAANPVAYLSLCMYCHNMYSEPPLDLGLERINKTGFNEKALRRLGEVFTSWGF